MKRINFSVSIENDRFTVFNFLMMLEVSIASIKDKGLNKIYVEMLAKLKPVFLKECEVSEDDYTHSKNEYFREAFPMITGILEDNKQNIQETAQKIIKKL